MCSDGLNDMIADDVIASILLEADSDMELAASRLVQAAKEGGGRDNVSVILIRVDGVGDLEPRAETSGLISRVRHWLG